MNTKKGPIKHRFRKNLILVSILPALASFSAISADSYWTNSTGNNQFFDANNWDSNTLPSLTAGDLYIQDTANQTVIFDIRTGQSQFTSGLNTLYIGNGSNNNAHVKLVSTPDSYNYSTYFQGAMSVGSDGGSGLLEYTHDEIRTIGSLSYLSNLDIGAGLNSNGVVSLTGMGKSTEDQYMHVESMNSAQVGIGTDGGVGELNINGSAIDIDNSYTSYYSSSDYAFSLGDGMNSGISSQGTMNVLAGGKSVISSGPGYSPYSIPSSAIGVNQGHGTLNISGSVMTSSGLAQSRAVFGQGLYVGHGVGSIGSINIENGGRLSTMAATQDTSSIGAYIGVNGGTGAVIVSGEGSEWLVGGETSFIGAAGQVGHLSIGESGNGSLTLTNGGRVSIGSIDYLAQYNYDNNTAYYESNFNNAELGNLYLAAQSDSVGTLNIGAAENEAAQGVGIVEAKQIIIGDGQGTVVFNHTDNTGLYGFDVDIVSSSDGQGIIKHVNGVTNFDTDRSLFTGKTMISGGTLVANHILGGSVSISDNGTLAGIGSVGSTVAQGGFISPGQYGSTSPSTLTIDGDLTMDSGSTYLVDISTDSSLSYPYVSDLISVNGDTVLNGASVLARTSGDQALFIPGSRWHILESTGGVTGEFGSLTTMPYVNVDYEYDPNNVYLVVTRNDVDICSEDMTSNECNVGGNIDDQDGGDINDVIVSQPDENKAKDALNQLSGEIHASVKSALLEDSRFIREAVNNRLLDPNVGTGAWGHFYTSNGAFDKTYSAAKMKRDIFGIFLGVDKSINESWKVGLVGGYADADIKVTRRNSHADRYDYHVGAYAKGQWDKLSLHTGLAYTWHDFSTERSVQTQGLRNRLSADYNASTAQAFTEGRYLFEVNQSLSVEPYINAAYVRIDTDGFTERGGSAKLKAASYSMDMFFTSIGSRFTQRYLLDNGQTAKIWGNVGWKHAYNTITPTAKMNFAGYNSFNIEGASISRDVAIVEVGTELKFRPNTEVGVMYNGQLGNNSQDHGMKAYINWRF